MSYTNTYNVHWPGTGGRQRPGRGPCKVYVCVSLYALCTYLDKNIFQSQHQQNFSIAHVPEVKHSGMSSKFGAPNNVTIYTRFRAEAVNMRSIQA